MIEVGEYVRTEFGNIGKFYRPASESSDVYYIYIDKDGNKISSRYDSIVKHSKNIIDLLEAGDYVNGDLVVDRDKNSLLILTDRGKTCYKSLFEEKQIKSIVTKEQFKSVEYIVKEEQ